MDEERIKNEGFVDDEDIIADLPKKPEPRFRITKSIPEDGILTDSNINLRSYTNKQSSKSADLDNDVEEVAKDATQDIHDGVKHVQLTIPAGHNHNDTFRGTHTHNSTTLGYLTHDAVPMSVFYRNQASIENAAGGDKRPTLDQLHKGQGLEDAKKRHWVS